MDDVYIAALHRAGAYMHLMNDEDKEMLEWVKIFKYEETEHWFILILYL
jgi:hypothetical protein